MEQTLDGLCVRVVHNHTFDGLWLRMANDFNRLLGRPAVRVSAHPTPLSYGPPSSVSTLTSEMLTLLHASSLYLVLIRMHPMYTTRVLHLLCCAVLCYAVLCCKVQGHP